MRDTDGYGEIVRAESGADLLQFGTILFSRKIDDMALLVENEIA